MGLITMKSLIYELAALANVPVLDQGGTSLIRYCHCRALVRECERSSVLILGIEGFTVRGNGISPDMDFIADFSELSSIEWEVASSQSCLSAQIFFDQVPSDSPLAFSFELTRQSHPTPDSEHPPTLRG